MMSAASGPASSWRARRAARVVSASGVAVKCSFQIQPPVTDMTRPAKAVRPAMKSWPRGLAAMAASMATKSVASSPARSGSARDRRYPPAPRHIRAARCR